MNRYRSDRRIRGGSVLATNQSVNRIKTAVRDGRLKTKRYKLKEGERLDVIAKRFLGDGRLWWVLAACSNIGWGLQVPPGTLINIPTQFEKLNGLI